jgi:hypothetical protein
VVLDPQQLFQTAEQILSANSEPEPVHISALSSHSSVNYVALAARNGRGVERYGPFSNAHQHLIAAPEAILDELRADLIAELLAGFGLAGTKPFPEDYPSPFLRIRRRYLTRIFAETRATTGAVP